jgi:hypothetical protein
MYTRGEKQDSRTPEYSGVRYFHCISLYLSRTPEYESLASSSLEVPVEYRWSTSLAFSPWVYNDSCAGNGMMKNSFSLSTTTESEVPCTDIYLSTDHNTSMYGTNLTDLCRQRIRRTLSFVPIRSVSV